jgi:MFS family permease
VEASGAEATTGPREALRLIRSRDFGLYFAGNAVSASGTWFQNLAASLLLYRLTHSALLLGVLNFGQFIPVLVLAPWTGAASDRFDRRRLLLVTQLVATGLSATLAALAAAGLASPAVIILDGLGLGITTAFASPTQQALVVSLVAARDVSTAVGLNSMTFNIARAIGPALAALVVSTLGIPAAFAVNSLSFLFFACVTLAIHPRSRPRADRRDVRFSDTLRLLRAEPRLIALLLIVMAAGFASDPVNTLSPAIAHAFGHRDTVAGFVVGAFGAGAVTAAFVLAGRIGGSRKRLALTLFLLGGGMTAFALAPWLELAFVFLFVAGFGYLASNTAATSRLQLGVSDAQRGRIMALWSVAFLGMRPFASLIDGAIASAVGVRAAAVVLATPALAAAVALLCVRGSPGPAEGSPGPRAAAAPTTEDRSQAARAR